TENPMPASSLRTELLKWVVATLLAAMLVGAAAMVYWLPVHGYSVACEKSEQISCKLERETSDGLLTSQVALGTTAIATVEVKARRRGPSRVFLYLNSNSQSVFAAEFEDGAAVAQAEAAAAELNRVFSSATPAAARVEARPPSYLKWLTWGGIGFLGMFVLVIYRELFSPERRRNNSSKPTPFRGAAYLKREP
ncbi:MAG: hypothetical protein ABI409_09500, partial [Ramlibacter sp.]